MTDRPPLGCVILVHAREKPVLAKAQGFQASQAYVVRNHYLARRLVTSQGYKHAGIPDGKLSRMLGVNGFASGISDLGEGLYFLGKLIAEWRTLRGEFGLRPETHYVKIARASECRFPEKLFSRPEFKELVNGYEPGCRKEAVG